MTEPHSTICDQIDFKLLCIQHSKKVHDKSSQNDVKRMMVDQTKKLNDEILALVSCEEHSRYARKIADEYGMMTWILCARATNE